jgi:hypothetical protein
LGESLTKTSKTAFLACFPPGFFLVSCTTRATPTVPTFHTPRRNKNTHIMSENVETYAFQAEINQVCFGFFCYVPISLLGVEFIDNAGLINGFSILLTAYEFDR